MKNRSKSGNGSNLEDLVRPRFDYIAYNIQVYIWVVQHDSSSLINCSRKLESVAKSSSYGYLPTPWWPCRVERVRRHYLLVSLFFSPSPHTWCILLLEARASIIDANRPTRPSDNRFYVTHSGWRRILTSDLIQPEEAFGFVSLTNRKQHRWNEIYINIGVIEILEICLRVISILNKMKFSDEGKGYIRKFRKSLEYWFHDVKVLKMCEELSFGFAFVRWSKFIRGNFQGNGYNSLVRYASVWGIIHFTL